MDDNKEFDEGFDLERTDSGQENLLPENKEPEVAPETAVQIPEAAPIPAQQAAQNPPETGRITEVPENIAGELDELRRLNPACAELAMEASPAGEAIRTRLEKWGAEIAQDRAEKVLSERQLRIQEGRQRQAQIDAYNRNFSETIKRDAPEFHALISDPKRKAEKEKYFRDIDNWIGNQSYREGQELMRIREKGNASEVCQLIKRFEAEANGRRAQDVGAYAFPARGARGMPASIGDASDFNAGWDLKR